MGYSYDIDAAVAQYERAENHVGLRLKLQDRLPAVKERSYRPVTLRDWVFSVVRPILDAEGVWLDWHPAYLAYAYALDRSQRVFRFMVDRIREHEILRHRWETRGLSAPVLDALDRALIFNQVP